jgi:SH3 domain
MTMTPPFQARAAYDFPGTFSSNHQLLIRLNDPLQVLDETATGWLWGTNLRTGQSGWFPNSVARLPTGATTQVHPYSAPDNTSRSYQSRQQQQQEVDTHGQGFSGQAMGGRQTSWSPPPPPAIIGPSASTEESSNVTYIPVPKGPLRHNPIQQTSWVVSKTARRTGRLFATASRKVGTTVLRLPPAGTEEEEKPPEIILPSVRLTGASGTETTSNKRRNRQLRKGHVP